MAPKPKRPTGPSMIRKMSGRNLKEHLKPISFSMKEQASNFYTTVGMGITAWSTIEGRLVQVVAKLLKTSEAKAGLVMYSIANFHVWIAIIDELFELDGTYKKSQAAWGQLVKSLKRENDIRVRLAHHSISQSVAELERTGTMQAYLRPGRFDTRAKSKKQDLEPLNMRGILDFTSRVGDIHHKLMELLILMRKRKSLR